MLEAVALNDIKTFALNRIAYARYKIGSTYYKATINNKEITSGGVVRVQFPIIPQASATVRVTEVQLINTNSEVWAKQTVSIDIETVQTGILYWFEFNVEEKEV
jgi:uncharacterized lipoprotein YbaY